MYTEEYERRGFPLRDFLLKLILVIIFVFLLAWLLPKFIAPVINKTTNNNNGKACTTSTCDTSGISALTSQIFADNLERMKDAAISYYTDERLPQEEGQSQTMTLSEMIGKKIIVPLVDKNNKACDVEKSYVKITKIADEYILKVNLKDSEKEDYILVHLGCYTYCDSYICQKQDTGSATKKSKATDTVPVKGYIDRGIYYPPRSPQPVVPPSDKPADDKHYCVKYDGRYYDNKGNVVSRETYEAICFTHPEDKHYCVKYDGNYYDSKGNVVSREEYERDCQPKPEDKHYCVKYDGKYYDSKGNVVSKEEYEKDCQEKPEDKHYCVRYNGNYYDSKGNIVSKEEYEKDCVPEDKHYCEYYNGKYYGKDGRVVDESTYKSECTTPDPEYLYEYEKTTGASFSEWTPWSSWGKADCDTQEVNCSDKSITCLKKLQMLKRKEKIGTYDKTYAKQRQAVIQTGSYQSVSCSKYNYVEIDKVTYATTTTTTYTVINTVTNTTKGSVGSWQYVGRQKFTNPPRDTATTIYKFAGADYSYCDDTCTTLPNFWYDVYNYVGGMTSVTSTKVPGSTSSDTTISHDISYEASCGEYVTKTVPIYSTLTITEKAVRKEPLYGTVCYSSIKTRELISKGQTQTKWSVYNDTSLLNSGWVYTGRKKLK